MPYPRNIWLAPCVFLLGCALLGGIETSAVAKKKDKKPDPILTKADELNAKDGKDAKLTKSPAKVFPVSLVGGKKYQIDLTSKFFDAYLRLLDDKGNEVAFNDDVELSSFDSRIVFQPAKTGEFKIVVTSLDGRVGKFSLNAVETDAKTPLLTGSRFVGKAIELKLKDGKVSYPGDLVKKDPTAGELNEKDPTVFRRSYKLFTVELEKDVAYRIESHAGDPKMLDACLFLETAAGVPLASDSTSGDARNPRIVYKAMAAGNYRVIVTSTREGQSGKFSLDVTRVTP